MTTLVIHPDTDPGSTTLRTTDAAEITAELARRGVRYEQWTAGASLAPGAGGDEVLTAYATDVDRLRAEGYETVDVVRLVPDDSDPEWPAAAAAARQKFLAEHTHDDDEVRFFVEGRGAFYLRIEGEVLIVVCEAGDLLSVPADTTHWFDMGTRPHFAAIRFFRIPEGWVGNFTGDHIAERFEPFDELVGV
jgi:1,2-dihydroxy-3-keto-5-methylthiopentene dioxygenase